MWITCTTTRHDLSYVVSFTSTYIIHDNAEIRFLDMPMSINLMFQNSHMDIFVDTQFQERRIPSINVYGQFEFYIPLELITMLTLFPLKKEHIIKHLESGYC